MAADRDAITRLLDDVCQLMRNQTPAFAVIRREAVCAKNDVGADRVGGCIEVARRLLGRSTRMDADL